MLSKILNSRRLKFAASRRQASSKKMVVEGESNRTVATQNTSESSSTSALCGSDPAASQSTSDLPMSSLCLSSMEQCPVSPLYMPVIIPTSTGGGAQTPQTQTTTTTPAPPLACTAVDMTLLRSLSAPHLLGESTPPERPRGRHSRQLSMTDGDFQEILYTSRGWSYDPMDPPTRPHHQRQRNRALAASDFERFMFRSTGPRLGAEVRLLGEC